MIICRNCGYKNREGYLFCDDCGFNLITQVQSSPMPTRHVDMSEFTAKENNHFFPGTSAWGNTTHFAQGKSIVLRIRNVSDPVQIPQKDRTTFGRSDSPTSPSKPDIDFAPYGAVDKGVSRQHAALVMTEDTLMLMDTGSSNGTYLNGQRLLPNQPRIIRDGDEIRFGKLVTHVYFK